MTAPLDWPALVAEAVRRRRAEGLTQKAHAALAGVSVPTIIAFDRAETTLSLAKAFDILRVVGLVAERAEATDQDRFVAAARQRWRDLVAPLPPDAPARHPHGYFAFDYEIRGRLRPISADGLCRVFNSIDARRTDGPSFPFRAEFSTPVIVDDLVEWWLGRPDPDRPFHDIGHNDFWRASPEGRVYLQRDYEEDVRTRQPGTILDLTLPVWRAGEALLHAESLAFALINDLEHGDIRFRAVYTGLDGREIAPWSTPRRVMSGVFRSRVDRIESSIDIPTDAIEPDLPRHVQRLLRPLYQSFDGFEMPLPLVEQEIEELRRSRERV